MLNEIPHIKVEPFEYIPDQLNHKVLGTTLLTETGDILSRAPQEFYSGRSASEIAREAYEFGAKILKAPEAVVYNQGGLGDRLELSQFAAYLAEMYAAVSPDLGQKVKLVVPDQELGLYQEQSGLVLVGSSSFNSKLDQEGAVYINLDYITPLPKEIAAKTESTFDFILLHAVPSGNEIPEFNQALLQWAKVNNLLPKGIRPQAQYQRESHYLSMNYRERLEFAIKRLGLPWNDRWLKPPLAIPEHKIVSGRLTIAYDAKASANKILFEARDEVERFVQEALSSGKFSELNIIEGQDHPDIPAGSIEGVNLFKGNLLAVRDLILSSEYVLTADAGLGHLTGLLSLKTPQRKHLVVAPVVGFSPARYRVGGNSRLLVVGSRASDFSYSQAISLLTKH